jgi:hypothetical protein
MRQCGILAICRLIELSICAAQNCSSIEQSQSPSQINFNARATHCEQIATIEINSVTRRSIICIAPSACARGAGHLIAQRGNVHVRPYRRRRKAAYHAIKSGAIERVVTVAAADDPEQLC